MATIIIKSITANPVRLSLTLNGQGYTLEYPNKATALSQIQGVIQDPETQIELALLLVLRQWAKTDPTLANIAQLVNKTCTITLPTVTIV
jgi:hypothetical protein